MRISEIKDKELRELAELRRREYGGREDRLSSAFTWRNTPENASFWDKVDDGIITELTHEKFENVTLDSGKKVFVCTEPRNVNNAADNALEEYVLDTELKSIATNSHSPLHEVKEVYRCVADVERTSRVIKAADEINVTPFDIIKVLTTFEL